ncbi:PH domain-containing protein [Patescibacteria group bacterium]|nr:PH domain-containing protein [Patescibacteria group bacterium]
MFKQGWWGQILFFIPLGVGIIILIRTAFLWKRNLFVITTHRLVDMDQSGFFETTISEVPYDQIEDVSGKVKGFWGTIFRFGTLSIQTGSGKVQIIVDKIKQPHHLQQDINERREKYLSKYSHNFSGDVADVIIDKLYELELPELIRVKKALISRLNKLR